jgi:hypothetical protein
MKVHFYLDADLRNQLHELRSEFEQTTRTATFGEPTTPGISFEPTAGCNMTCHGSCSGSCSGNCSGNCAGTLKGH